MRPERVELPTFWFVAKRSIQLSYGRTEFWNFIMRVRELECWRSGGNFVAGAGFSAAARIARLAGLALLRWCLAARDLSPPKPRGPTFGKPRNATDKTPTLPKIREEWNPEKTRT